MESLLIKDITDFLPNYKQINEDNFYQSIYKKKEFYDDRLNKTEDKPDKKGGLMNHQKIISKFLSSRTIYDKLLLFHDMGTGKTCSAVAVAEQIRSETPSQFKGVLYLAKGNSDINKFIYETVFVCTDGKYIPENYDSLTNEVKNRRTKAMLRNFYKFNTFQVFAKNIRTFYQKMIEKYSNYIIIIDEVHNLRIKDKTKDYIDIYKEFYRFLHNIKNCKILLLSGTPMKDNIYEISSIMNLLLPVKNKLPKGEKFLTKFFDNKDGIYNIKPEKKDELKKYFRGNVSYVDTMQSEIKKTYKGNTLGNLKHLIVSPDIMSSHQSEYYIGAYETDIGKGIRLNMNIEFKKTKDDQIYKIGRIKQINSTSYVIEDKDGIENTIEKNFIKKIGGVYSNSRDATLFVFPDGTYGDDGFKKYITSKKTRGVMKKDVKSKKYSLTEELKNKLLLGSVGLEKFKQKDIIIENIREFSIKYAESIKNILRAKKEGKCVFIYNTSVNGGGLILFSLILELFGFSKAKGKETTQKPRYTLLSGDMTAKSLTNIIETFNKTNNKNGEIINVILGSKKVSEGYTFKNIQIIEIHTPWFNYSEISQAIARGYRLFSHKDLVDSGFTPEVEIFQKVSIPIIEQTKLISEIDLTGVDKNYIIQIFNDIYAKTSYEVKYFKPQKLPKKVLIDIKKMNILTDIISDSFHSLVFYSEEKVVSFIQFEKIKCENSINQNGDVTYHCENNPYIYYIQSSGTLEDFRRRGLNTILKIILIIMGKSNDVEYYFSSVREANKMSIFLNKKIGLKKNYPDTFIEFETKDVKKNVNTIGYLKDMKIVNLIERINRILSKNNIYTLTSIDLQLYEMSEIKDVNIKGVERLLKESAIDCSLTYERNHKTEYRIDQIDDKSYTYDEFVKEYKGNAKIKWENAIKTRDCDYSICNYKCDGMDENFSKKIPNDELDYSTYQIYYNKKSKIKIKKKIIAIFRTHFNLDFQQILEKIPDYTNFELLTVLSEIIDNNIKIINKFGFECYLREQNNVYFIIENLSDKVDFYSLYYTNYPFIENRNSYEKIITNIIIKQIFNHESNEEKHIKNLLQRLPRYHQEIILELSLKFKKEKNTNYTDIHAIILKIYNCFMIEIDNIYISSLLYQEYNVFRCLTKNDYGVFSWKNCNDDQKVKYEKYQKKFLDKLIEKKEKYYGQKNCDSEDFCIRDITGYNPLNKGNKSTSGQKCSTWQIPQLLRIIKDLKIPIPLGYPEMWKKFLDGIRKEKNKEFIKNMEIFFVKNFPEKSGLKGLSNGVSFDQYEFKNQLIENITKKIEVKKTQRQKLKDFTKDEIQGYSSLELIYTLYWYYQAKENLCEYLEIWFSDNDALIFDNNCGTSSKRKNKIEII